MISIIFIAFALISYAIGYDIWRDAPAITQQMAGLMFGVIGTLFLTSSAIVYAIKEAAKKAEYVPEEMDKLIADIDTKLPHPNDIR